MNLTASRLAGRMQMTTDGHAAYLDGVSGAFGTDIDYAMLIKLYGAERAGEAGYSPPDCISCKKKKVIGKPDRKHISTS
jgi:hypothetical protein